MKKYVIISIWYYSNLFLFIIFFFLCLRQTFVLRDYRGFFSNLLEKCCVSSENNAISREWHKGNHFDRTSIETIFSPHTILRDARPRSQERV